ncbi:uncharacterized protein MELLADRAFT_112434 [Melampsora larici-populina 98AG31]|uniref:Uncharacterized protein n=1 Tax=Melampsora larici-populina (strain 98AG31 / pathotype 3-4-7) TaxID=747676 RepID=F4S6G7_MELLP|nr:uncharacterized protein MELLADRAFT_112434 [Melampsora larici-populina 98AG31]EGF99688.1 hypothetical protein MELLADRAFT_112434 [Melampsora larici-populina 98AG31]
MKRLCVATTDLFRNLFIFLKTTSPRRPQMAKDDFNKPTGHGVYFSGNFEIEAKVPSELGHKSGYRSYVVFVNCGGADRDKETRYEIRAIGYTEEFKGEVINTVGVTGLGIVSKLGYMVEECCKTLRDKNETEDPKTMVVTVKHTDYHPTANRVSTTCGHRDTREFEEKTVKEEASADGSGRPKPKKFAPRPVTAPFKSPVIARNSMTSKQAQPADCPIAEESGSESESEEPLSTMPATKKRATTSTPKKRARALPEYVWSRAPSVVQVFSIDTLQRPKNPPYALDLQRKLHIARKILAVNEQYSSTQGMAFRDFLISGITLPNFYIGKQFETIPQELLGLRTGPNRGYVKQIKYLQNIEVYYFK